MHTTYYFTMHEPCLRLIHPKTTGKTCNHQPAVDQLVNKRFKQLTGCQRHLKLSRCSLGVVLHNTNANCLQAGNNVLHHCGNRVEVRQVGGG